MKTEWTLHEINIVSEQPVKLKEEKPSYHLQLKLKIE